MLWKLRGVVIGTGDRAYYRAVAINQWDDSITTQTDSYRMRGRPFSVFVIGCLSPFSVFVILSTATWLGSFAWRPPHHQEHDRE